MERFSKDGRLIIPLGQRKRGTTETDEERVRYLVTEAYCPNGCNIIDKEQYEDWEFKVRNFLDVFVQGERT